VAFPASNAPDSGNALKYREIYLAIPVNRPMVNVFEFLKF